ncbi:OLC1v1003788C2 [Oldenlandia corymbosa var. corymbosa]|uniref:OLC1v1003788C2 n=1 Tax=Oldenlandia corymbosa var. corymbosa TaxID=529605 RepID=A0AAV1DAT7_OLDCO|nr:OLC1v1003788C2 [Oldenlandia corymbosa var. corymbosa]
MSSKNPINEKNPRKRPLIEEDRPTTVMCTVVGIDHTDISYTVCSACEKTLPEPTHHNPSPVCRYCSFRNAFKPAGSKRLFRVLMSIATDTRALVVVMFDRAARVLFGCTADEFYEFAKIHPSAAMTASKVLDGEMLSVTLSKPKNGNAQHLRVASVVPLSAHFQPAIVSLREFYQARGPSQGCNDQHMTDQ